MTDRYVDRIKVAVQFVDSPVQRAPNEVWICEVEAGGVLDDPQALVNEVSRSLDHNERTPPYTLDDTYRVFSWGASGFFEHIVVRVLESALTDEIKQAMQAGFRRLVGHVNTTSEPIVVPRTREELEGSARFLLIEEYQLSCEVGDLELVSDARQFDADAWDFRFRYDGWYYEVTLIEDTGLTRIVNLWRGQADDYGH